MRIASRYPNLDYLIHFSPSHQIDSIHSTRLFDHADQKDEPDDFPAAGKESLGRITDL